MPRARTLRRPRPPILEVRDELRRIEAGTTAEFGRLEEAARAELRATELISRSKSLRVAVAAFALALVAGLGAFASLPRLNPVEPPGTVSVLGLDPSVDFFSIDVDAGDNGYFVSGSLQAPSPAGTFAIVFRDTGLRAVRCTNGCQDADHSEDSVFRVDIDPAWSISDGPCTAEAPAGGTCYGGSFLFELDGPGSALVSSNGRTALISFPRIDLPPGASALVSLPLPGGYRVIGDPQPYLRGPWQAMWIVDGPTELRTMTAENEIQQERDRALTFLAGVLAATAASAALLAVERLAGLRQRRPVSSGR